MVYNDYPPLVYGDQFVELSATGDPLEPFNGLFRNIFDLVSVLKPF
jgi:hypothetical protein